MIELEQQVRQHLRERAEAGPDPTELRAAVQLRLGTITDARPATRPQRLWLVPAVVVGLIAALAVGLAWVASPVGSDRDIALETDSIADRVPLDVAGAPVESGSFALPLTLTVPDGIGYDVRVASDSLRAFELSLDSERDTGEPGESATLRILTSPSLLTVGSVLEDLEAGLVHTRLLGIEDDAIGGYQSRVARMESDLGMTLAGFKLGPGMFLSASGVDRRYDAHVITTTGGVVVVWIDAPFEEFDQAATAAGEIMSTLRWRS